MKQTVPRYYCVWKVGHPVGFKFRHELNKAHGMYVPGVPMYWCKIWCIDVVFTIGIHYGRGVFNQRPD